ncbi:MAG: radical SAM protein [Methylophilaceae bacterium]|nr:radical SAM protein [Methylophilaceae bacterium]MBL6726628.1 radical SAM protein [Methylophilaceae bacterium]MBL6728031.1 radical SAM protein [Methylophilaceae bacterium]MBL6790560.1 radical SAM protein [Methylophilaceae bacterium]
MKLVVTNHNRDIFKTRYVYPVVSRRAGGLSLGINLNTNNACNWQCIYCEVPNLTRGKPDPIDLNLLRVELQDWLKNLVEGDFIEKHTDPGTRFKDIALSGNGEPTACKEFKSVLRIIEEEFTACKCPTDIKIRLITNGSYLSEKEVQDAWQEMPLEKEIWFKIDSANTLTIQQLNQVNLTQNQIRKNLESALSVSSTVIQTCLTKINGQLPQESEICEYVSLLKPYEKKINSIHLYSLARPTEQKTLYSLERLSDKEMIHIADKMDKLSIPIFTFS